MARQIINIGTTGNDGTGDTLCAALIKANGNFTETYNRVPRNNYKFVASVGLTGKTEVVPLTTTNLTPTAVDCSTTGATFQMRVAAPAQYDAVRVLIPNLAATAVTGVKVGFTLPGKSGGWTGNSPPPTGGNIPASSATNPNNDDIKVAPNTLWTANSGAYGWRNFYFRDRAVAEVDLPPAYDPNQLVPSYTATDWTPVTPAARTDGGTLPLIDVRVQYPPVGYGRDRNEEPIGGTRYGHHPIDHARQRELAARNKRANPRICIGY